MVDDDDEFDVSEAMERAKADKADPSEKIFNVMKYGAVTGGHEDPTGEITDSNHAVRLIRDLIIFKEFVKGL